PTARDAKSRCASWKPRFKQERDWRFTGRSHDRAVRFLKKSFCKAVAASTAEWQVGMSKHFDRVNNRIRPTSEYVETRPTVYRAEEHVPAPVIMEPAGASQGYDSLLSYWHMLVRHKTTLLCFALAGLAGAIIYSLLQTPLYRARTSVEIQD